MRGTTTNPALISPKGVVFRTLPTRANRASPLYFLLTAKETPAERRELRSPTQNSEDKTFWALRGGYSQDNWAVNAWYGQHNTSETVNTRTTRERAGTAGASATGADATEKPDDTTIFSVSGSIDVGKVGLVVIHENKDDEWGQSDSATVFNVNYHFTKKSRVYGVYIARDYANKPEENDDEIRIGMRMDF